MTKDGVSFQAILTKITSTTDGGWNLTLSLSEKSLNEVRDLMSFKDRLIQVGCILIQDLVENDDPVWPEKE